MKNSSVNSSTFFNGIGFRSVRFILKSTDRLSSRLAARMGLYMFLTPPRNKRPITERRALQSCVISTEILNGKNFRVFSWGRSEKKVLLCHAWGGRTTQLHGFIEGLVQKGFQVIGFDAIAHGMSAGRTTDMIEYSSIINSVFNTYGPFYGVIGHSFGAGNAVFSIDRFNLSVKKLVLIGCFAHGEWVIERFGEVLGLPGPTVDVMKRILEEKHHPHLRWKELDISRMAGSLVHTDVLLFHDVHDHEIPYTHAEEIKNSSARIKLHATSGAGHRRILREKDVIFRTEEFFLDETP